jgi:hypothetical protein
MLVAIQLMGVMLLIAGFVSAAGWWHLALQWWQGGNVSPITKQKQSRWIVMLTSQGLYLGRECKYAYAYA